MEERRQNAKRDSSTSSTWSAAFFRAYGHDEPPSPSLDGLQAPVEGVPRTVSPLLLDVSQSESQDTPPWWESARDRPYSLAARDFIQQSSFQRESDRPESDRLSVLSEVLLSQWPPLSRLASNASSRPRSYTSSIYGQAQSPTIPVAEQRHPGKDIARLSRHTRRWEPDIPEEDEEDNGQNPPTQQRVVDPSESKEGFLRGIQLVILILGLCLVILMISIDRTTITTAIPLITHEFHSTADVGWYGSAYLLTACAFQPVFGRVFMLFDVKWSYLFSMFFFMVGSLLSALAPSSATLIFGRAVAGFGSAGILTGSFMIIAVAVPVKPRPIWTAVVSLTFGLGASAGPIIGGVFTDLVTWRWCFWTSLVAGGVTLVIILLVFHPIPRRCQERSSIDRIIELDLIGTFILIGALTMLFLALQYTASGEGWGSPKIIGLLCGSGVAAVVFVVWQWWKQDGALIPPSIITQRRVTASCLMSFFTFGALMIHAFFLPIWFQAVYGSSAIESGIAMIPYFVAIALFSLVSGVSVSRFGYATPPAILGSAIGAVGCGFISTFSPDVSTGMWIGYEILASAGFGLSIQQGFTAVQAVLADDEMAIGTACVVASQSLGGAIFVSVANTVFQSRLRTLASEDLSANVVSHPTIRTGEAAFRDLVSSTSTPQILDEYVGTLQIVFIVAIPLAGLACVSSCFLGWKSIRTNEAIEPDKESEGKFPRVSVMNM